MIQGGDPTGTGRGGESAWGGRFNDEIDASSARLSARLQKRHRGDGQRRSKHQRLAVFHHARRLPVAAKLHDLRTRHRWTGRGGCDRDLGNATGRQADFGSKDGESNDRRVNDVGVDQINAEHRTEVPSGRDVYSFDSGMKTGAHLWATAVSLLSELCGVV